MSTPQPPDPDDDAAAVTPEAPDGSMPGSMPGEDPGTVADDGPDDPPDPADVGFGG
jgi:hypothetical protein